MYYTISFIIAMVHTGPKPWGLVANYGHLTLHAARCVNRLRIIHKFDWEPVKLEHLKLNSLYK